ARAQLSEARAVFARLNASTWQALAESELAACGERSAARSLGATGPLATLTPREFEVAREVASGASNPEAAERLFISRRTVGYHLSSVFRKLDIDDRHRLSAFFRTAESDPQ
ncbi:MAG: LuxR C-terminal-related transcriptional regulator, partial [Actinomycetia bacterium]|nr:LuxR C-terminal-related transcriptional regulator [Actinomycetes bacterium]